MSYRLAIREAEEARQQAFEDGELETSVHDELLSEMRDALLDDPTREVDAPAFSGPVGADEVIRDDDSAIGATVMVDLLRIVGRVAKQGDAEAIAWIEAAAKRYALAHLDAGVQAEMRKRVEDEPNFCDHLIEDMA